MSGVSSGASLICIERGDSLRENEAKSVCAKSKQNHLNQDGTNFLPRVDVPDVSVHTLMLCCFHSGSIQTFRKLHGGHVLTA